MEDDVQLLLRRLAHVQAEVRQAHSRLDSAATTQEVIEAALAVTRAQTSIEGLQSRLWELQVALAS
jgi:uncharacterized protein YPO0396